MKELAGELDLVVKNSMEKLNSIPAATMQLKLAPGKWSKKEIMGHLVDSAQNNIRRFIVAQYEDTPYIVYNQDKWVAVSGYQSGDTKDLLQLWYLLNKQLSRIWTNMEAGMAERSCRTQQLHTLEWLAADYIKHLRHHLHHVLDLEPIPYP